MDTFSFATEWRVYLPILVKSRQHVAGPSARRVWDAETVVSNPSFGMDVCPRLFVVVIHLSPYRLRYIILLLRKRH
jgi:hypothetical protein